MWQEELNSLMFENLDLDNQERPMKASFQDKLETFIQKAIDEAVKEASDNMAKICYKEVRAIGTLYPLKELYAKEIIAERNKEITEWAEQSWIYENKMYDGSGDRIILYKDLKNFINK